MEAQKGKSRSTPGVIAAVLAYLAIALAFTYPFVIHPENTLTAPLSFDVSASVAKFQTLVREHQNPFVTDHLSSVGWPGGVTTNPTVDREAWISTLCLWVSSEFIGTITTHSLLNVLGLFLTAVLTCLFICHVTRSMAAGFIAGLTYGFFPHMLLIGSAAPTYCWMGLLLLPMWAYYNFAVSPSLRRGILAGLAPLPAMFWTPYFALHVCVVALACGLVVGFRALVLRDSAGRRLLELGPAAAIPALGLAAYLVIAVLEPSSGVPARSLTDAFQESAHPLMYVIPGWGSSWGTGPYEFLLRHVPRAKETNLYVGVSVIVLSLVALGAAARAIVAEQVAALRSTIVVLTLIASAVVVLCFMFSLPPRLALGGHAIPMPDALVIKVQPAFRGGQRFVMPLMGGMAVLTGLGFNTLQRLLPTRATPALVVVLAPLVLLDLFAYRPRSVNQIPQSAALAALRAEPSGPVFQYIPSDGSGRLPPIRACLLQPQYDKPLIDTCDLGPQSADYMRWIETPDCTSIDEMRAAGVRYVIVDDSLGDLVRCIENDSNRPSRKIADDDNVSVYGLS